MDMFLARLLLSTCALPYAAEQIVGRERRERVSQLTWCGEGCFDSRRRVNSTVRAHRCVRTASGSDPIKAQLEWMIPSLPLRVLTLMAARLALRQTCSFQTPRSRVSLNDKPVARYNLGRSNKSLDAVKI